MSKILIFIFLTIWSEMVLGGKPSPTSSDIVVISGPPSKGGSVVDISESGSDEGAKSYTSKKDKVLDLGDIKIAPSEPRSRLGSVDTISSEYIAPLSRKASADDTIEKAGKPSLFKKKRLSIDETTKSLFMDSTFKVSIAVDDSLLAHHFPKKNKSEEEKEPSIHEDEGVIGKADSHISDRKKSGISKISIEDIYTEESSVSKEENKAEHFVPEKTHEAEHPRTEFHCERESCLEENQSTEQQVEQIEESQKPVNSNDEIHIESYELQAIQPIESNIPIVSLDPVKETISVIDIIISSLNEVNVAIQNIAENSISHMSVGVASGQPNRASYSFGSKFYIASNRYKNSFQNKDHLIIDKGMIAGVNVINPQKNALLGIYYGISKIDSKIDDHKVSAIVRSITPQLLLEKDNNYAIRASYAQAYFKLADRPKADMISLSSQVSRNTDFSKISLLPYVGTNYNYMLFRDNSIQRLFINVGLGVYKDFYIHNKVITPKIIYGVSNIVWQRRRLTINDIINIQRMMQKLELSIKIDQGPSSFVTGYNYGFAPRYKAHSAYLQINVNF